jgi:hypothetical protein
MRRPLLLSVLCVAMAATSSFKNASAQGKNTHHPQEKLRVIYVVPHGVKLNSGTKQTMATLASTGGTIALWNYSIVDPVDHNTYTGNMVGRSPFFNGHRATTIPTYIIPVKLTFMDSGDIFDPSVADSCAPGGASVDTLVVNSPIFQNYDFMMNGVDVGSTQYLDGFQRANFWSSVGGTPYHTLFNSSPTVLSTVNVSVPVADGTTIAKASYGTCHDWGEMDINWWDNFVQSTIFPALVSQGVGPANFPQFIFDSVVMTQSMSCCILGYHNAYVNGNNVVQTYSVNDYDAGGDFVGENLSVMTHEVAEWMDDPYGSNPTPYWGAEGQVPKGSCQNNLEVGDPLTGTNLPGVTLSGVTYSLQELAFFSWYYGQSPSLGSGGKYSDNGTFAGYSKPCPPGGTN